MTLEIKLWKISLLILKLFFIVLFWNPNRVKKEENKWKGIRNAQFEKSKNVKVKVRVKNKNNRKRFLNYIWRDFPLRMGYMDSPILGFRPTTKKSRKFLVTRP